MKAWISSWLLTVAAMATPFADDSSVLVPTSGPPMENVVQRVASPVYPNGYYGYAYIGCFQDNPVGSSWGVVQTYTTTNSGQVCIAYCFNGTATTYTFAATEGTTSCYCGQSNPAQQGAEGQCSSTCPGDGTHNCGGPNGFANVYQLNGVAQPIAQSSLASLASVSSASVASRSSRTSVQQASLSSRRASRSAATASVLSVRSSKSTSKSLASVSRASARTSVASSRSQRSASISSASAQRSASLASARASKTSVRSDKSASAQSIRASRTSVRSASLASVSSVQASIASSRSVASSNAAASRESVAASRASASASKASVASVRASQAANYAYRFYGCYNHTPTNNALPLHPVFRPVYDATCAAKCSNHNFFGLVNGANCWCGGSINLAPGGRQNSSQCFGQNGIPCASNGNNPQFASRMCGGVNRMSIYAKVSYFGDCSNSGDAYTLGLCYTVSPSWFTTTTATGAAVRRMAEMLTEGAAGGVTSIFGGISQSISGYFKVDAGVVVPLSDLEYEHELAENARLHVSSLPFDEIEDLDEDEDGSSAIWAPEHEPDYFQERMVSSVQEMPLVDARETGL